MVLNLWKVQPLEKVLRLFIFHTVGYWENGHVSRCMFSRPRFRALESRRLHKCRVPFLYSQQVMELFVFDFSHLPQLLRNSSCRNKRRRTGADSDFLGGGLVSSAAKSLSSCGSSPGMRTQWDFPILLAGKRKAVCKKSKASQSSRVNFTHSFFSLRFVVFRP